MFSRPFAITSYRISSKSNLTNIACHRSLHLACRNLKKNFIVCSEQKYKIQLPMIGASFIRHQSVSSEATKTSTNEAVSAGQTGSSTAATTAQTTVEENSVQLAEEVSSIKEIEEWFRILEKVDSTDIQDRVGLTPFQKIDASGVENLISQIPDAPTPILSEVVEVLAGEPTLASLGLGGSWPSGWVQHLLNWMHVTGGLPWWATIVITTVCARLILFPVVIRMQRYTAKMHNVQPQIQALQAEMSEARKMGDHMEVARISHDLYAFMKQKGIDPLKNAVFPLIQAPIFLSFFWGIRGMVHAPVESMKTGGLYWFSDLTVPDPLYILPVLTSTTLFVTIKTGTDFMRVDSMGNFRYVMQAAPFIMFPFIMNFEGAILCYWVSTNIFSLVQVSLLRLPKVRSYFEIPVMVTHDINKLPATKKKFVQGFKDSWTNMKVAREVNARAQYDEIVFQKAGMGPVPKTYKFDPTKITQLPPSATISKPIISQDSSDAAISKSKTNKNDSTKIIQARMPGNAILSKKKDD